ncbi:hypothetical protein PAMP_013745 [Pampus punctatissimus]
MEKLDLYKMKGQVMYKETQVQIFLDKSPEIDKMQAAFGGVKWKLVEAGVTYSQTGSDTPPIPLKQHKTFKRLPLSHVPVELEYTQLQCAVWRRLTQPCLRKTESSTEAKV